MGSASPLQFPSLRQVRVTDPFWSRWQRVVATVTLERQYEKLVETGRIDNFRRAATRKPGEFSGYCFNDSDVYKWIEAASLAISCGQAPAGLGIRVEEVISAISAAQMDDGYLNTFFQLKHPEMRWRNLSMMHEMYCAGHLFEAAVAHFDATGTRDLLDVAVRLADHIGQTFGPGLRKGYCGHEEVELGLLALARVTESRAGVDYRGLATWMVQERGSRPSPFEAELADEESMRLSPYAKRMLTKDGAYSGEYLQDHLPLQDQREAAGHSVRAMYLFAAATEACYGRGFSELDRALEGLWENVAGRRMYVTGGVGSSGDNEGFTRDFDLPNRLAYAETCAACGLIFWAVRFGNASGSGEYSDVMETALYNGALSGIGLGGDRFFYDNPLESTGHHHRREWFECACCPPNIARTILSVGRYAVSASNDTISIALPIGLEYEALVGGQRVVMRTESAYPWSGDSTISIEADEGVDFELRLRIPGWCNDAQIKLAGSSDRFEFRDGFACCRRFWSPDDRVTLRLSMPARWIGCASDVSDNIGRVALARGPIVYCLEEADLGTDCWLFEVDPRVDPVTTDRSDLAPDLAGFTAFEVAGQLAAPSLTGELYPEWQAEAKEPAMATFVPYFFWGNREAGSMQVWSRVRS